MPSLRTASAMVRPGERADLPRSHRPRKLAGTAYGSRALSGATFASSWCWIGETTRGDRAERYRRHVAGAFSAARREAETRRREYLDGECARIVWSPDGV